jgi:ERCC4-type nuclease
LRAKRRAAGEFEHVNDGELIVRIVADDRENAGGVIGELRERTDVLLEVRRLPVGDFLVEDNFASSARACPNSPRR